MADRNAYTELVSSYPESLTAIELMYAVVWRQFELARYAKAREMQDSLVAAIGDDISNRGRQWINKLYSVAIFYRSMGDFAVASEIEERIIDVTRSQVSFGGADAKIHLVQLLLDHQNSLRQLGKYQDAVETVLEARSLLEDFAKQYPKHQLTLRAKSMMASSHWDEARLHRSMEDELEEEASLKASIASWRSASDNSLFDSSSVNIRTVHSSAVNDLGLFMAPYFDLQALLNSSQRFEGAIAVAERQLSVCQKNTSQVGDLAGVAIAAASWDASQGWLQKGELDKAINQHQETSLWFESQQPPMLAAHAFHLLLSPSLDKETLLEANRIADSALEVEADRFPRHRREIATAVLASIACEHNDFKRVG